MNDRSLTKLYRAVEMEIICDYQCNAEKLEFLYRKIPDKPNFLLALPIQPGAWSGHG